MHFAISFCVATKYKNGSDSADQKKSVFYMIATEIDGEGEDQFRQRMAWALSQIIVVTPNQVSNFISTTNCDHRLAL